MRWRRAAGGCVLAGLGLLCLGSALVLPADTERAGGGTDRHPIARDVETGNVGRAIEALLSAEATARLDERESLLLGILLLRQGRAQEAIPRLQRVGETAVLGDYALYHAASAQREVGNRAAAAEALQRLLDLHPKSLFAERASRDLPRDWLEAGDLPRAEATAGRYLATYRNGAGVAAVWVTFGETLLRAGRPEEAEKVFRRVWIELPASAESQRAREQLLTMGGGSLTPEERYQRADTLYRLGRFGQAVPELTPFAATGEPNAARARLALGISTFNLRQYDQAAKWLAPLRETPGADQVEALFWLGRSAGRAGDSASFARTLTALIDLARESRRAEEALYLLAQSAVDDGDLVAARRYLARLLGEHPKSAWKADALWLDGWVAFKQQDRKAALAAWARLLADEPRTRLRVQTLYWRGRVLETVGNAAEAVRAYQGAFDAAEEQPYYRLRAAARLARAGRKTAAGLPTALAAPATPAAAERLHADKARALRALGLLEEAAEEYREQVVARPEDRERLGEACRAFLELERYDRAVWLGKRLLQPLYAQERKLPVREYWQCLFPLGYARDVSARAREQGLDPLFVTALMREESTFAPRAVSRAGARGLMQVMPETADRIAREQRLGVGAASLEVPEANIRFGTLHLAELMRLYRGNQSLVLAGYNAGRAAVQRWLDRYGFADEEAFIEDIPYAETRGYVKRVLGTYQRYRELYAASGERQDQGSGVGGRESARAERSAESPEPGVQNGARRPAGETKTQ